MGHYLGVVNRRQNGTCQQHDHPRHGHGSRIAAHVTAKAATASTGTTPVHDGIEAKHGSPCTPFS